MLVTREIFDPSVAEFLQNASEEELRAAMEDIATDIELKKLSSTALHDSTEDSMSAKAFLNSIGHGSQQPNI